MAKLMVTIPVADLERLAFFDLSAKPLLQRLYAAANLEVPSTFVWQDEAERIITTLQAQGFNTRFPISKTNSRERAK
jgi:hypothetical protein